MKTLLLSLALTLALVLPAQGQELRKQSAGVHPLVFLMIDSSDHITGKTGLSPTVTLSKDGGTFASPSGAVTEIGSGWYKVAANATDTNTLGPLVLHATGTGADPTDKIFLVVPFDPFDAAKLGLSIWPSSFPANFPSLSIDGLGRAKTQTQANYVKNTALANFTFQMLKSSDGTPLTGLVDADFTKKYRLDNGAVSTLSGSITEIDSVNMPGMYQINLSAAEMNGTVVTLRFKTAASGETEITVVTSQ